MASRRTFLKITGGALALLLGLGEVSKILPHKPLLRPPGGQDETSFISRCLRCDRCRSVCPTSVIGLANLSDSIMDARTPVMKFHLGYCNFCHKCVEVCPTQALKPFDSKIVRIGLATVKKDICMAWDFGGCTVCLNACPYHAIALDGQGRPLVDPHKCNGCGICEKVCPALVMRSYIGGNVRGIVVTPIAAGRDGGL
ncbi:4Fe-4S dicluster domain-containing protein [Sporomusa acidovorans]|uniref:Ferredoxin-type protein NapG n=1 Tax=Sporomusa acidovorans (strain ATCC 49682 / DSM 3132 / Mol) TaxID=1123286 RepID=A0ABZ3J9H6_SPOA4|nr:4Fe-4S dicluster domain-containing protein [Sporomusa acidovorans]OZC21841.1 NAD(P)H-quinone oxidoreductase subunit I, chloroplastic [Sporomusa acidovorans DSM 3132]SDD55261.1 ferredoxin-type protein NapG [Sporomusa acidovorans]